MINEDNDYDNDNDNGKYNDNNNSNFLNFEAKKIEQKKKIQIYNFKITNGKIKSHMRN